MTPQIIAGLFTVGEKLIDHWFPDAEEADKRKAELALMAQQGKLQEMEVAMSAIIAEANSKDPWTSRARPSFMYVIYALILSSIPMGVLFAFSPETAQNVTAGFQAWLHAIPSEMLALFGVGYLGYAGARMSEKKAGASK